MRFLWIVFFSAHPTRPTETYYPDHSFSHHQTYAGMSPGTYQQQNQNEQHLFLLSLGNKTSFFPIGI